MYIINTYTNKKKKKKRRGFAFKLDLKRPLKAINIWRNMS